MSILRSALPAFLFLFLVPPVSAQEKNRLPADTSPAPVEGLAPVPQPKIEIGNFTEGPALPENLKIENQEGSISGNTKTGIQFGGPVKVSGDNGLEIFADRATVDLKTKSVIFNGNVSVYQGNTLQRGSRTVYFYDTGVLDASDLRISIDPILMESGKFISEVQGSERVFIGRNAGITTHDVENPNFWVRSDKTTVYPGDRVTFKNLKLYANETPIFWLPYLSQSLDSELGYHFTPGARSNWGPFILNSYGIMLGGKPHPITGEKEDAWLLSRWKFDLRAERGAAIGLDLVDTREPFANEITGLSLYYTHDLAPDTSRTGFRRSSVDPNRYKAELKYRKRFDFEPDAEWRFDSNMTVLSDSFFLEDFNSRTFRTNPAPDNTLGIYRRDDDSLLSLYGRFRVNDFYRTDTKSPEIAFDQVRKPLFGSSILHEGQTSFSVRGAKAGDITRRNLINPLLRLPANDPRIPELLERLNSYERNLVEEIRSLPAGDPRIPSLRAQLLDTGYNRFHTNHGFSLPMTLGDWFTFTPHLGGAYTHYSAVTGPSDSDARLMLYGGAETSVKFSKNYSDVYNRDWGLDGMLHVLEPYVNWSVLAADELDRDFPKIDRLTFTTRPRSLDPLRFTAIDEFDSWNIVRLGVRNRLITHRDNQSHEWLFVETYVDSFSDDPEGNRNFSNLYNDITWQPLPWLGIYLETQLPILDKGSGFSELNTSARFMPHENFEFSVGYRHLNNHPVLLDSERISLNTYLRLSENWGIGSVHAFEMNEGILELQQYMVQRDLGNWITGVGISHRENRFEDEFAVIFSLTLKNFPSASLPFSLDAQ